MNRELLFYSSFWQGASPKHSRLTAARCVSALLTVILHSLLLWLLLGHFPWLTQGVSTVSQGEDMTGGMANADRAMQWIMLMPPSAPVPTEPLTDTLNEPTTITEHVDAVSLQTPTAPEIQRANARELDTQADNTGAGDDAAVASAAQADYFSEIRLRIERAWQTPLALGEGALDCEVALTQNAQGQVLKVSVEECGGDEVWRSALTRAVNAAAPLPAAPSVEDFQATLHFHVHVDPLTGARLGALIASLPKDSPATAIPLPSPPHSSSTY